MNELRRKDRGIPFEKSKAILEKGEYGVLSTTNRNGTPYGVPLNYSMIDNSIYFHCAVEGILFKFPGSFSKKEKR